MKKKYIVIVASIVLIALIVVFGQIFTVRNISVVFYNNTGLADEASILAATGLEGTYNIFNIKESDIKKNIANAYPDNSITVTNIVREFPNKVVIYVKERIPVFKLKVHTNDGTDAFVPTDKDFQMGTVMKEVDGVYIDVIGFEVYETFDIKECIILRNIANTLIDCELSEEALPYFINAVNFIDGKIIISIRQTGATFTIDSDSDDISQQLSKLYKDYLALDEVERYGANL